MTDSAQRLALVTNATGFAGPPAVAALQEAGWRVMAHDPSFADPAVWERFRVGRARIEPIMAREPEEIVAHAAAAGALKALVSNDHHPAPAFPPESAPLAEMRANYEKLVEFPFRLVRAAMEPLAANAPANVVMITSNRAKLPLAGSAFADAARAGANALTRSLAVDCAARGVVVNAVAPNFLYSEAYYPAALFKETEAGRDFVRASVPVGRLGDPAEIGELILFLATSRARFLTGAVVDFSGGWPFGPPRPQA